jgi:hypothetical protein
MQALALGNAAIASFPERTFRPEQPVNRTNAGISQKAVNLTDATQIPTYALTPVVVAQANFIVNYLNVGTLNRLH